MAKVFLTLCVLNMACTNKPSVHESIVPPSFDLKKDILDLTNTLNVNDTLFMLVNASVCQSFQFDSLLFYKKDDIVFVNTTSRQIITKEQLFELGPVLYQKSRDSLNYENLFQYILDCKDTDNGSVVFTLICHEDTLHLYSHSLRDHLNKIGYYMKIQHRVYPDAEPYQPVYPPKTE